MLWNSGRSLPLPAYSFVATLNCVTCLPLASARISGSRVRRPVSRTLFTVISFVWWRGLPGGPRLAVGPVEFGRLALRQLLDPAQLAVVAVERGRGVPRTPRQAVEQALGGFV